LTGGVKRLLKLLTSSSGRGTTRGHGGEWEGVWCEHWTTHG
jgi:hypothetical protein